MTGCDKGVLLQAQLFREVQESVKNKPRSANLGTFLPLAVIPGRDHCLVTACSHAGAVLPPRGCGDFLTVMLYDLFSQTEVRLAAWHCCRNNVTAPAR